MDPHTARCLQLSSSISMPFNPYHRPQRFSDPSNRSRFPVTAPLPHVRGMSSAYVPPRAWHTPASRSSTYQAPYTPLTTSRTGFIPQQYIVPAMHSNSQTKAMDIEESYFQSCLTPDGQLGSDSWNDALNFAELGQHHLQNEGLGVDFAGVNDDITPTGLAASTQVESQELASTRGDNSWVSYPESPDRRSWSTLSTSSGEILSDFSEVSNMSDMPCLTSELSSGLGMTLSREDTTPMLPQQTTRKPNNRRVAQPPLHHSYRRSPYPLDHSRSRSASIASQSLPRTRCPTPLSFINDDFSYPEPALSTGVSSETMSSGILSQDIGDFDTYFDERPLATQQTPYKHDNVFMPTSFEDCFHHDGGHSVLHSSSDFSLHQTSSSSDHRCESHYADFADPPDLFGPLQEDQLSPPPEDMNPEDPDMTPRKQELRFEGDLYTPKYVRGHGNKREGWCGICKPGRWLVLKNSAFWYDKSFSHGISAATGTAFDGPRDTRRMSGNPDVWEGLCGSCGDWIALISSKKKGTTWFRHAYKCHTHQKVKDTPKRRREANQNRIAKLSKSSKAEHEGKHELSETLEPELNDELELPARAVSTLQTITAMI